MQAGLTVQDKPTSDHHSIHLNFSILGPFHVSLIDHPSLEDLEDCKLVRPLRVDVRFEKLRKLVI